MAEFELAEREWSPSAPPKQVRQVVSGSGEPLDAGVRREFEARYRHDFRDVRVHRDERAAQSADAVGANAYTFGRDVVFGRGQYDPHTHHGRQLLGHELAHVVQQRPGSQRGRGLSAESEADSAATNARSAIQPGRFAKPTLQRQEKGKAKKEWYMLKPPPVVAQNSMTCWAAALSSWLSVTGRGKASVMDLVFRYAGTSCIKTKDNSLPNTTAQEVFLEWGVEFEELNPTATASTLWADRIRHRLEKHGHLILADLSSGIGHVMVVYGHGFDAKGNPDPNFISVMDPLDGGALRNINPTMLKLPVAVGHAATPKRPAACRAKPGEDPDAP